MFARNLNTLYGNGAAKAPPEKRVVARAHECPSHQIALAMSAGCQAGRTPRAKLLPSL